MITIDRIIKQLKAVLAYLQKKIIHGKKPIYSSYYVCTVCVRLDENTW